MASDRPGEIGLRALVDVEDAVLRHESMELLLPVRHSGRQRRDVPVHVGVALLAAQAEAVHPLGRDRGRDGSGDAMHSSLECEELLLAQLKYPVLDVLFRCDQAMAEQGRIADEESSSGGILVDFVVWVVGLSGYDPAHKARTFLRPARIRRYVKRHLARLQVVHRSIVAAISCWQLARAPDQLPGAKGRRVQRFCVVCPWTESTH